MSRLSASGTNHNNNIPPDSQEMSARNVPLLNANDDLLDQISSGDYNNHHPITSNGSHSSSSKRKSRHKSAQSPSSYSPATTPPQSAIASPNKRSPSKRESKRRSPGAATTSNLERAMTPQQQQQQQNPYTHTNGTTTNYQNFGNLELHESSHTLAGTSSLNNSTRENNNKQSNSTNNDSRSNSLNGTHSAVSVNTLLTPKHLNRHELDADHPVFTESAMILRREERAKIFRVRLRFALAASAVLNFILVIIYFFMVTPPGMGEEAWDEYAIDVIDKSGSNISAQFNPRKKWNLFPELDAASHSAVYASEGIIQLLLVLIAQLIFFLQFLSRNPKVFQWLGDRVPRSVGRASGIVKSEVAEAIVWCIHCPIGFAEISPRFRYLNGVAVLRLYVVVLAGMQMTDFGNSMMRVMSNFFGLRLTSGVFLRWALEFHKWKVLIPTFFFLWFILALCFAFAEGLSYETSLWFIMVTMTTVGYGDVYPLMASGRIVAMVAMCVGLVVLAYIVSQVQQLTTRPAHEQKVLDALRLGKMRGEAKVHAAHVLLARFRLKRGRSAGAPLTLAKVEELKSKLTRSSKYLKDTVAQIRLLPPVFDAQDEALTEIRENVRDLKDAQKKQQKMISDLTNVVTQQQQMISQLLAAGVAGNQQHQAPKI